MNALVDTHAHIYLDAFSKDIHEVMERAEEARIEKIYMPNIDHSTIDNMMELETRYDQCIAMMGLHPCSVDKKFEKELYLVEEWLTKRKFVAIGEIGTDLHWDKTFWAQQQEAFSIQLNWAKEYNIPVVIHCRESIEETIELVARHADDTLTGIFHCYTGDVIQANKIIELGFYLGIGGVSTFKNGGLDKVLPEIDLEHIVLETDSPYLAPVPHRGKRNEPSYVSFVAERVATIKQCSLEEVANKTTGNAFQLFKVDAHAI
ncbi:TatD family deoxyribonuclease [Fulvivirga sp. M361]|uniref:TatD family hydrolase n=1 Tax=Fulvivirga sp. M361 TaxID=2594266 RepID=UPI00117A564A|nr:TatD family hydrolase [Fulvivirga sp. M361]TRX62130.1 TatD family deoxyribonuclease [Fulvivirga sp. M361]